MIENFSKWPMLVLLSNGSSEGTTYAFFIIKKMWLNYYWYHLVLQWYHYSGFLVGSVV